MSSRSLLLVLVILACLQCFTMANNAGGPSQCCFNYTRREISKRNIKAYKKTMHQCTKPGVIFILNKGQQVCADPRLKWVKERMNQLNEAAE